MSRSRRAIATYGTGVFFTIVTMGVGLVAIPFLLTWLGEERYGAFRAMADWYGYLTLFQLGLGGALLPLLARAAGQNDVDSLHETLGAGIRAYTRVTAFMFAGALVLAAAIRYLVPVNPQFTGDLQRGALVAVVAVLVTPFIPFRHLNESRQRGYRVNLMLVVQSLIVTGTALFLAYNGWGITGQMVAIVLGGVLFFGALTLREVIHDRGLLRSSLASPKSSRAWKELWHLSRPTLIRQICGRVSMLSDRIIVAALLGPAMVVPLFVTQKLAELAQSQVQSIGSASWPAMAELHARGERDTFNDRLAELSNLVLALSIAMLAPIVAYNHHFVALWVGTDRYAGDAVTVVAGLNAMLLALVTIWDTAFGGTGLVARLVPVSLFSTAINLTLSLALTPKLGVLGPLLGTLTAMLLTSVWYVPVLLKRTFNFPIGRLINAVRGPLLWGVPFAGALWWVARSRTTVGWAQIAGEMAAAAIAYLLIWWVLMLRAGDRDRYLGRMRQLFGR